MLIPCPWCGSRHEIEFHCAGPHVPRPNPAACSDEQWTNYLYYRDNPRGVVCEHWFHAFGCRQWISVERHTVTNAIVSVAPAHAEETPA